MKKIPFVKYTLHGNKFTIVDETLDPVLTETGKSDFADKATNIHHGVASDNFLVVQPCGSEILKEINDAHHYWDELPGVEDSDYVFRMFEPDGKEALSCGNGLLCIANYLYRQYGAESVRIMTEIPMPVPKIVTVGIGPLKEISWANMGHPRRNPPEMVNPSVVTLHEDNIDTINDIEIKFPNNGLGAFSKGTSLTISGYLVFTGEPHFVVFTESGFSSKELADMIFNSCDERKTDFSSRLIRQIGMSLNKDYSHYFPQGMNINFVRVVKDAGVLEYRCFERGINRETRACGTGAVAASFVARRLDMLTANHSVLWPYCSHLKDPKAQLCTKEEQGDYLLYGHPALLFEGTFFA